MIWEKDEEGQLSVADGEREIEGRRTKKEQLQE
jgi:hypothetical protein